MLQDVYGHLVPPVNEKNALQIPKQRKHPWIRSARVSYGSDLQCRTGDLSKRNQFSIQDVRSSYRPSSRHFGLGRYVLIFLLTRRDHGAIRTTSARAIPWLSVCPRAVLEREGEKIRDLRTSP